LSYTGFCIFITLFYHNIHKTGYKLFSNLILIIIFIYIIIQSSSTYNYFQKLSKTRNGYFSQIIWRQIKANVPTLSQERLSYFYFEHSDKTSLVNDTLFVGFPNHASVVYNLPKASPSLHPHATDSLEVLKSLIEDGEALTILGYEAIPLPKSNIYAFRIEGENLINIKEEILERFY